MKCEKEHAVDDDRRLIEDYLPIEAISKEAAQNAAQQNAEPCCTASHTGGESAKFNTEPDLATQCDKPLGGTGLEPVTSCV